MYTVYQEPVLQIYTMKQNLKWSYQSKSIKQYTSSKTALQAYGYWSQIDIFAIKTILKLVNFKYTLEALLAFEETTALTHERTPHYDLQ